MKEGRERKISKKYYARRVRVQQKIAWKNRGWSAAERPN